MSKQICDNHPLAVIIYEEYEGCPACCWKKQYDLELAHSTQAEEKVMELEDELENIRKHMEG